MAHSSFTQEIFINAPLEVIRSFLVTLDNHPKIHPLIVAIQHDSTTTTVDGAQMEFYRITDRMQLGSFSIKFTYRVTSRVGQAGELIYEAFQFPSIYLHNTTIFQPEGTGTRLREDVAIDAPRLLLGTVYKGAIQSHQEMFAHLKGLFEKGDK